MIHKLIYSISLCIFISYYASAQYKALEINLNFSNAEEVSEEDGLYFSGYSAIPKQHTIGFSMPVSDKILITPKIGLAKGFEQHVLNTNILTFDSLLFQQDSTKIYKSNRTKYLKFGLESTYWLNSYYQNIFFSAELQGLYNTSANSTLNIWKNEKIISSTNANIGEKVRKFVPSLRLSSGFNAALFKYINFYISLFIEIRQNSYYYDVQNYAKVTKGLKLGIKFVLGGKSILQKAREENALDN